MRSLYQAIGGCVVAAALLSGCTTGTPEASAPSGGSVSPSPAASASPTPAKKYVTEIGACLNPPYDVWGGAPMIRDASVIVECTASHRAQIVGAGEFGPAGATNAAMSSAYTKCDKMATAYLKEDWRNGRLEVKVERPGTKTQPSAERWWECLIVGVELSNFLKVSLAQGIPADLRYGCQQGIGSGKDITLYEVDCATPHEGEYAGAVVMPAGTPFPKSTRQWDAVHRACAKVVGAYVGVSADRVTVFSRTMRTEDAWSGLRDVRCYAYFGPKKMTGSAKGTKGKGVPW